ncbi:MAG: hypothetical protein ABSH03_08360 [Candidatus Lustribacter sp.]|jgi:hypothetical protein
MSVHRLLGPVFLALAIGGPLSAGAQTAAPVAPNSLAAQTKAYFTAVLHADGVTLSGDVSSTFHLVRQDGSRLDYSEFLRDITKDYLTASNPMGVNVDIKSSEETGSHATETVDTLTWWYGALSIDPMSAPVTSRYYATHELSWTKSAAGTWLLDEDHITSIRSAG